MRLGDLRFAFFPAEDGTVEAHVAATPGGTRPDRMTPMTTDADPAAPGPARGEHRIATLTLNRPAARNALSSELLSLLPTLMHEADGRDVVS